MQAPILKVFLNKQASFAVTRTPLGGAATFGKTRVVELLLKRDAKIYQEDAGATVLDFAIDNTWVEVIRLLLQEYSHLSVKKRFYMEQISWETLLWGSQRSGRSHAFKNSFLQEQLLISGT